MGKVIRGIFDDQNISIKDLPGNELADLLFGDDHVEGVFGWDPDTCVENGAGGWQHVGYGKITCMQCDTVTQLDKNSTGYCESCGSANVIHTPPKEG